MEAKDIWILIGGVILGLIGNYFVNYTSAPLANWYRDWQSKQAQKRAKQSVEKAKKRIEKIKTELAIVKSFRENPIAFNAFGFDVIQDQFRKVIGYAFLALMLLLTTSETTRLIVTGILVLVMYFTNGSMDTVGSGDHIFRKVQNFASYESDIQKQIAELQEVVNKRNPK